MAIGTRGVVSQFFQVRGLRSREKLLSEIHSGRKWLAKSWTQTNYVSSYCILPLHEADMRRDQEGVGVNNVVLDWLWGLLLF